MDGLSASSDPYHHPPWKQISLRSHTQENNSWGSGLSYLQNIDKVVLPITMKMDNEAAIHQQENKKKLDACKAH